MQGGLRLTLKNSPSITVGEGDEDRSCQTQSAVRARDVTGLFTFTLGTATSSLTENG